MKKTGLVLEGGSFRGVFSAGALDYLIDHHISFPYVIGVSAGAGNAANFIAGQKGRTKKVITHENAESFYGLGQLKNRKLLDLDKIVNYEGMPFDFDAYFSSGVESEFVIANCETGKAEYMSAEGDRERLLDLCKASCSVPMMTPPVPIGDGKYLDGSIIDSIPFERALKQGCDKVVVILTRREGSIPTDYARMRLLINVCYHSTYPKVVDVMMARSTEYARQMRRLEELEKRGRAFIIRPEVDGIGHFENSLEEIDAFYNHGYEIMSRNAEKLQEFLKA